jgi:phenylalanyl-tRNA synthetase beta chain
MKFTFNWLKDFVEIRLSPDRLAKLLTMAGLEVTSLEKKNRDWVFEVEVTSNRPDLLSVLGIAREVSAITGQKLIADSVERLAYSKIFLSNKKFKINIESKRDCPLYTAKIIKEVKVGPSEDWLKERLELIGCRSINNIVDITNYVMFTLGQPLHAFDLDKLKGSFISVRRAEENEVITTLDGETFNLNKDILVIADSQRPIAIAGIMGGKDTEVDINTKNILLESAKFDPLLIRRMRQKLNLASESQYRFERDVDINNVIFASDYAVNLIKKLCAGTLILSKITPYKIIRRKTIIFNPDKADEILGVSIKRDKIKRILSSLGFKIKQSKRNKLKIEVPPFRKDIKQEVDLIEEIARIWGYDKIPSTLPYIISSGSTDLKRKVLSKIKNILINQGFSETINYSLISFTTLKNLKIEKEKITSLENSLSKEQEILRPLLVPGLLSSLSRNIRHYEGVCLFEIGRVFTDLKEVNFLGIALCGKKVFFKDTGKIEDNFTLLHLKGVLELILKDVGIKNFDFVFEDQPYLEYGFGIVVRGDKLGYLGKLDFEVADYFDINKKDVFVAELNLDVLLNFVDLNKRYKPLPIYPVVRRDISLMMKEEVFLKDILKRIELAGFKFLKEIKVIDFYKGAPIPSGFKGITLSCFYYSDTHTLTDEEIDSEHNCLRNLLEQEFSVQLR